MSPSTTTFTGDPLEIPAFLVVTKADMPRRKAAWDAQPPVAMPAFKQHSPERSVIEAEFEAAEAERARASRARLDTHKRKEADAKHGAHQEWHPGCRWDASRSRWVQPGCIAASKYARLMREMPTPEHQEALRAKFGFGQKTIMPTTAPKAKAAPVARKPAQVKAKAAAVVKPKKAAAKKVPVIGTVSDKDHKTAKVDPQVPHTTPRPDRPIVGSTKHQTLMQLLGRPEGATLAEIANATGWQLHTAQARIGGVRKVFDVPLAREARGTVYRLGARLTE